MELGLKHSCCHRNKGLENGILYRGLITIPFCIKYIFIYISRQNKLPIIQFFYGNFHSTVISLSVTIEVPTNKIRLLHGLIECCVNGRQSSEFKVTCHSHVCRKFIVQFLRSLKQHVKRMGNEIRTDPGTVFLKLTVNQRNEREAECNRIRPRANICLTHYSLSTLSALERLKCRCHYSKRTPKSKVTLTTPPPSVYDFAG